MASWASSASAATQVVPVLSAAILMKLVDLLIVLITISVIVSLVRGGMIRSRFHSNYGGAMVVIGLVLCLGTYAGNILLMTIPAFSSDAAETGFAQGTMPDGLFWLLTRAAFTITLLGMLVAALHRKRAEADANTADMVAKVAQDSIARSEARFRALFETTSNSIFCFSF
ncbi:MAG: hypothetical protein KJO82_01990, partial [Gammaproteobacteria bacterium]|nr:hypothetical protein [Gammaproteobacteria bacterium]